MSPWSTPTMVELSANKVKFYIKLQPTIRTLYFDIKTSNEISKLLGSMGHHGNHGMNMGGMAMGGTLPAHHTPYSRYEIIFHF